MKKTGAEIIVKLLEMYGIKTVAGIPGGSILPLYDELNRSSIRHILPENIPSVLWCLGGLPWQDCAHQLP